MKTLRGLHLHLDPVSGIAGDMTVAALVDAGVPANVVSDAVGGVGIRGLRVRFETRRRGAFVGCGFVVDEPGATVSRVRKGPNTVRGRGLSARTARVEPDGDHLHTHVHSDAHDHGGAGTQRRDLVHETSVRQPRGSAAQNHHHRDYAEIRRLLKRSKLDPDAKALAEEIFARLAEVEAALHGTDLKRVTFHEVGAFDSIADIVGMSAAIAWLAPLAIGSSFPVVGTGTVRTAHGIVPIPAPATAALLRDIPMIADGHGELTTPTGAAFLATVVDTFGPPPPLRVVAIGYGAGTRDLSDRPNVLRVMLGAPIGVPVAAVVGDVLVLESNIDDMTGQLLGALCEALFQAGALDVWSTPIVMKKGRSAQQISALAEPSAAAAVERAFFLHSTTLGIRIYPVSRRTLARSFQQVQTAFGPVNIKIAGLDGAPIAAMPEYEDCRRLATASGVPVRQVWTAAVAASAHLSTDARQLPSPRKRTTRRSVKRRPS